MINLFSDSDSVVILGLRETWRLISPEQDHEVTEPDND
ncbi:hypothetical protein SVI_1298 [Shewanella violacea DSS12]|uniref:Uncharacterized protein n=1 Tax=Shewanella violacea (strain JCM 10179 / CIP 106290 / LMG 19151 / DSS12) TaxID=637905 RepID=D4ZHX0_SHEVD|nr:hypothetical protein SVI_1298 [Shewanella violacea DSS12]